MYELTICIPTYRRPAMLRDNLAMLVPQVARHADVEVMVVDNASGDETPDVVAAFARQCPRVRYIRNPSNVGFDGNTARCIEVSQGRYTALLADDDRYLD